VRKVIFRSGIKSVEGIEPTTSRQIRLIAESQMPSVKLIKSKNKYFTKAQLSIQTKNLGNVTSLIPIVGCEIYFTVSVASFFAAFERTKCY
jgi:hypothetical protein